MTRRATQSPTLTLYSVFHDPTGDDPFEPLSGMQYPDKRKAIKELQELRPTYPGAYLVKVVMTKCLNTQKGR
ncbi:MAG: hypothetical protein ABL970_00925 [Nitrospira sp.]